MEETRENFQLVDVLRRTFRPSAQLENALGAFVKPGQQQPRFLVQTLSSLVLDSTVNHSVGFHEARLDAEKPSHIDIQLGPRLAARRLASGALKIFMSVDHEPDNDGLDINWLNYSALIHKTKQFIPDARLERDLENKDFAFYTVISPSSAIPQYEIKKPGLELLEGLQSESTKSLYRLTPESLSVIGERREILPEYEQPFEQAS